MFQLLILSRGDPFRDGAGGTSSSSRSSGVSTENGFGGGGGEGLGDGMVRLDCRGLLPTGVKPSSSAETSVGLGDDSWTATFVIGHHSFLVLFFFRHSASTCPYIREWEQVMGFHS